MAKEVSRTRSTDSFPHWETILIIVLCLLVGATIGGLSVFYWQQAVKEVEKNEAVVEVRNEAAAQSSKIVVEAATADWHTYTNTTKNFSVKYPTGSDVDKTFQSDESKGVEFAKSGRPDGDLVISISYLDTSTYHPKTGTDLKNYVVKNFLLNDATLVSGTTTIAGEVAIKADQPGGQVDPSHEYYFVKDGQLYIVTFQGKTLDRDVEKYFLGSLTFTK